MWDSYKSENCRHTRSGNPLLLLEGQRGCVRPPGLVLFRFIARVWSSKQNCVGLLGRSLLQAGSQEGSRWKDSPILREAKFQSTLPGTAKMGSRRWCPTSSGTGGLRGPRSQSEQNCKEEFVPFARFIKGPATLKRERAIVREEDGAAKPGGRNWVNVPTQDGHQGMNQGPAQGSVMEDGHV